MSKDRKQAQSTLVNGDARAQSTGDTGLVKNLFGVPNERGGVNWLDECPDYLQAPPQSPDHALITRYKESRTGPARHTLNLTSIEVQSSYLKQILRQIFRTYPGVSVDEEELSFDAPFHPFFHRWATLVSEYEKTKEEENSRSEEIGALLNVLNAHFGEGIKDAQNMAKNGNIAFDLLWSIFPLGVPVFGTWKRKQHCYLVNETKYLMAEVIPTFVIEVISLDHDGERYGWGKTTLSVAAFGGSAKISALPVVPLPFYDDASNLVESLGSRGARAADLLKGTPVYKAYEGPIRLHRAFDWEEVEVFINGRMLIDAKSHSEQASRYCPSVFTIPHRLECLLTRDPHTKLAIGGDSDQAGSGLLSVSENLNRHPVISMGTNKLSTKRPVDTSDSSPLRHHRWTDAVFGLQPEVFCRSVVRGYDLSSKAWAEFEVDNVAEIKWNRNAFDALVIPSARKRLLEALVKQQQTHKTDAEIDDIVQGKGQGLIMLLAGPPGTGKTLTAESIADRLHLPLYAVSASELGDSAKDIEQQFGHILKLAAAWNAVLLLDEADAFLEKRNDSTEARDRNKRVAAFLRILEYYKGILILTTNRVVNFDDAFYSRIHLTLAFKSLDQKSRQDIWKNFLRDTAISESDLTRFASQDLNGRQIKNIMKMSRLLAKDEGASLNAGHIRDVLDVATEEFAPESINQ